MDRERLELVLEVAGMDLWENDLAKGTIPRKATKIFSELGYSAEESANYVDDLFKTIHPEDIPRVKAAISDHVAGVTQQYSCEFRVHSKSGQWVWYANYGRIVVRTVSWTGSFHW